jgi:hypothetical protein
MTVPDSWNDLQVTRGGEQEGCFVVIFYRVGSGYYSCLVSKLTARNDAYLRSLVTFMQHKVPRR